MSSRQRSSTIGAARSRVWIEWLGSLAGYAVWMWLTTPPPSLDGASPLTLLERGETDRVADAVRGELQGDIT